MEQGGRVERRVVGVGDRKPGRGQPVERGSPGENGARQAAPAVARLGVEQRLGDPGAAGLGEDGIQLVRTEGLLDEVPAVDRLDLRLQSAGKYRVANVVGVTRCQHYDIAASACTAAKASSTASTVGQAATVTGI